MQILQLQIFMTVLAESFWKLPVTYVEYQYEIMSLTEFII